MSRDLVLDASAALEAVLGRSKTGDVLDLIEAANTVRAPDLYAAEVGNALWKHIKADDLDLDQAQRCLRTALDLVDSIIPSGELVGEAMATAVEYEHPVNDALYLVTARRTGSTVCTLDRRFAALLKEARVPVDLI
jgi:predicted nucleic acid-binding protein